MSILLQYKICKAQGQVKIMNKFLYNVDVVCPVCKKTFESTKVKLSTLRPEKTDSDFFVKYGEVNPVLYEINVCKHCGYAGFQDSFDKITNAEIVLVKKNISAKWVEQSYSDERDVDKAVNTYKMMLINLKVRSARASLVARTLIRIAWCYRLNNDAREDIYLEAAAKAYSDAYQEEEFPIGKLDEATCLFIIGECYKRAKLYEESLKWFGRNVSLPPDKKNPRISEMIRDQMDEVREAIRLAKAKASQV